MKQLRKWTKRIRRTNLIKSKNKLNDNGERDLKRLKYIEFADPNIKKGMNELKVIYSMEYVVTERKKYT